MARTAIKGTAIEDHTIQLNDIDLTTSGQALVTSVIAGAGITIASTGVDAGTGTVTVTTAVSGPNGLMKLDQTTPQTIVNGSPMQNEGIQLGTSPTAKAHTIGRMYWDNVNQTVTTDLNNNIKLHLCEIKKIYQNVSGATINIGTPVYITGSNGSYCTIAPALVNGYDSAQVIGLTAQSISNNTNGYVVENGKVENINASGSLYSETWVNGDTIYMTESGNALTNIVPHDYSFYQVKVGTVLNNHAVSGCVLVDVKLDSRNDMSENIVNLGVVSTNVNINPQLGKLFTFTLSTSNISLSLDNPTFIHKYTELWLRITQGTVPRTMTLLASDANVLSANSAASSGDTITLSTTGGRTDLVNFIWNGFEWVYTIKYLNIR